jgi:hypothetical protein
MTPSTSSMPGANRFGFSAVVFFRLFALVHLFAFVSALTQLDPLIGPGGIAPAGAYLSAAHEQLGRSAYWQLPTLCWLFGTGAALQGLCVTGIVAAAALFAGLAPILCLAVLWACYLSIVNVGQMFYGYQWDGLLLEATLAALFAAPAAWWTGWRRHEPPRFGRLVLWWLLFRLMFLAGVVKLTSGDPTWRNLTALTFHYETQPLPTPLAWYAHQAPLGWHRAEVVGMFVIELGAPLLIFASRRLRHAAALAIGALMCAIAATGNYTFFNLLAVVLCLFCFDDAAWAGALRQPPLAAERVVDTPAEPPDAVEAESPESYPLQLRRPRPRLSRHERIARVFAYFAFAYTGVLVIGNLAPAIGAPPGFRFVVPLVEPLRSFNNYGLFAVMTHPRLELAIEGSRDDKIWQPYEFPAKPGALDRRPVFVAPMQPRLDWQLWFAALEQPGQNPWLLSLYEQLLRGSPGVSRLLAHNPFAAAPPRYLRVLRYEYHFTDRATRAATGRWWDRQFVEVYAGPLSLR